MYDDKACLGVSLYRRAQQLELWEALINCKKDDRKSLCLPTIVIHTIFFVHIS